MQVLYEFDFAGSYAYAVIRILKRADGALFWDSESGCSCPIPFSGESNAQPFNWNDILREARDFADGYAGVSRYLEFIAGAKAALREYPIDTP